MDEFMKKSCEHYKISFSSHGYTNSSFSFFFFLQKDAGSTVFPYRPDDRISKINDCKTSQFSSPVMRKTARCNLGWKFPKVLRRRGKLQESFKNHKDLGFASCQKIRTVGRSLGNSWRDLTQQRKCHPQALTAQRAPLFSLEASHS